MESNLQKNILIVSSESYLGYTKALLSSLFIHNNGLNVYLYLINVSEETTKGLKDQLDGWPIDVRSINKPELSEVKDLKVGGILYSELMAYSANIRVKLIRDLFDEDIDSLFYIDADSLVVRNIDSLFETYIRNTCSFHLRPTESSSDRVLSGIMFYTNTMHSKDFLDFYKGKVDERGILKWFSDQEGLAETYERYKGITKLVFGTITKDYIDWRHTHKSKIWIGKGRSRSGHKYIEAQEHYKRAFDLMFVGINRNKKLQYEKTNIILYIDRNNETEAEKLRGPIIEGIRAQGDKVTVLYEDEYCPSNIAIVIGGLNKSAEGPNKYKSLIYEVQDSIGGRVLAIDRGFIKSETYHSIGWDKIGEPIFYNNRKSDADRLLKLDISIHPWKPKGKYVLLCGQRPLGPGVQFLNENNRGGIYSSRGYMRWIADTVAEIREKTDMGIRFRPHPLCRKKKFYIHGLPRDIEWTRGNLKDDLKNAYVVVSYNSNVAIDALKYGVPVMVGDPNHLAYNFRTEDILNLHYSRRRRWLSDVAYTQWTIPEIKKGLFWKHLKA